MTTDPETDAASPPGPVVLGRDEIRERVAELGKAINGFYDGREGMPLLVIGVMKGAFVFLADLARTLEIPVEIDFLAVSSYRGGTESSGSVTVEREPRIPLRGRDVLLVEDIVDSGKTMNLLVPLLEARGARSVEVCSLLIKREKAGGIEPRWVGFDVPDEFLVGYGMDYDESFRHLADIASLQKESPLDGL